MAFVLAGIALFLANSETLRLGARTLSEVALGPRLTFETTVQPKAASKSGAVVYRTGPSVPLILSGFPAYQSAAFLMPIDARPTSGYLQINATVQALAGIEGVLRISIGNSKRAELLLRPGEGRDALCVSNLRIRISQESSWSSRSAYKDRVRTRPATSMKVLKPLSRSRRPAPSISSLTRRWSLIAIKLL